MPRRFARALAAVASLLALFAVIAVLEGWRTERSATARAGDGIQIVPGPSAAPRTKTLPARAVSHTKRPAAPADHWQVMYLGDQRIGYARTTTRTLTENRRLLVRTATEVHLSFKRFGQPVEMHKSLATDETAHGDLLGYTLEMRNPPAAPTRVVGKVDGQRLLLTTTTAGRTHETAQDWDAGIKSPAWEQRALREPLIAPGQTRTFRMFVPDLAKAADVRVNADEHQFVKLHDGSSRKLLKLRTTQSLLPGVTTRSFVDESGATLRTEDDFGGQLLVTYAVDRQMALEAIAGAELDLAAGALIKTGTIRTPHETTRAVYRISIAGEDAAAVIPAGPSQIVRPLSADTLELTVERIEPPRGRSTEAAPREYAEPAAFLQSGDPKVIEHARKAALGQSDPWRAAVQMEQYVFRAVAKKNFSTALASAADVARSLEGDCTEHAVLLAAMLRAAKIPSRIAVGLVYVDGIDAFGGHMWTEAWIGGVWVPLDATLGRGGIGAAHIKLSDSSFADDAPAPVTSFLPLVKTLGAMTIEVIETR